MIIFTLTVLGLALGSFVNALVWRVREQETPSKRSKREYSVLWGRSMCPHCHHMLAARDLAPVISWLLLKGRCRYCKNLIHRQYPLVEIFTAVLLVLSYIAWPYTWGGEGVFRFAMWVPILVLLVALFIYDLRWMLLPDRLTAVFVGLVALQLFGVAVLYQGGIVSIRDALLAVLPLGAFFYVLFQASSGRWIGGGDVKLGFGLGLLAGNIASALLILFLASAIGTVISSILMVTNKASRKTQLPFGPFLIAGAIIVQLWGSVILSWYENQVIIL